MEIKTNKRFRCDQCRKEAEGGDSYMELPEGWNYAYFNDLGNGGNEKKHYCSKACFLLVLDGILQSERESRLSSFLNR